MNDETILSVPAVYEAILADSLAIGFPMPSDKQTGALLRTLAASKPGGQFLELGTGTGLGAAWILDGIDRGSRLVSVENESKYIAVAKKHLGFDPRVVFVEGDGLEFLRNSKNETYDFIYADTWPGKYVGFEHSLRILKPGGLILLDDMLPQPTWPADHPPKVTALLQTIDKLPTDRFSAVRQCWYTGHIIIAKKK